LINWHVAIRRFSATILDEAEGSNVVRSNIEMEEILVSDDACAHLEVFLYMPSKQAHSYKLLHSCTHFSSKNKPTGPKDLCAIANNPGHK
jgi:hypothetical protein